MIPRGRDPVRDAVGDCDDDVTRLANGVDLLDWRWVSILYWRRRTVVFLYVLDYNAVWISQEMWICEYGGLNGPIVCLKHGCFFRTRDVMKLDTATEPWSHVKVKSREFERLRSG